MEKLTLNRRTFIKRSSQLTATSLLVSSTQFAAIHVPRPKKDVLGVALVGLGYYSTDLLAPALQRTQYCKLKGIVTGSPEKVPVWQKRYGIADKNVYSYDTMDQIADNEDIDVIYIVLPTGLHSEYGIKAANTGKHVWCEKPMARTVTECQALINACKKNKVKLSIGYRMHHEPNTQKIMQWTKSKPYGPIQLAEAAAGYFEGRTDHWKQKKAMGGGALYDMGVYSINGLRYAIGLEPIAITSAKHETTRPEVYHEVDETTYFELEFPDGIKGIGATSFGKGMNRLHVTCEKGWYELQPFQAYGGIKGTTSDGMPVLNESIPNQQARQMDDDALAIINETDVMVPGEEGLRDIRIVEAIYEAAAKGTKVKL